MAEYLRLHSSWWPLQAGEDDGGEGGGLLGMVHAVATAVSCARDVRREVESLMLAEATVVRRRREEGLQDGLLAMWSIDYVQEDDGKRRGSSPRIAKCRSDSGASWEGVGVNAGVRVA